MQSVESQSCPSLLKVTQVAERLGISVSKLWAMVAANQLPPPVRLSHRITRWRETDLASFVERLESVPSRAEVMQNVNC